MPGMCRKIAAVQAHALDADAIRPQLAGQGDHLGCGGFSVIGVDQQNHVVRMGTGKMLEGGGFIRVCLDVGVRHGAEQRDVVQRSGQHGGAAGKSRHIARPRRE